MLNQAAAARCVSIPIVEGGAMPRRHLNRADVEFYDGRLVLAIAMAMAPKNSSWEQLTHNRRQACLDRALDALEGLVNDDVAMARLNLLHTRVRVQFEDRLPDPI